MSKSEPLSLTEKIKAFAAANGYEMVPALPASFHSESSKMIECHGVPVAIGGKQGKTCPVCGATILYGGGRHYRPKGEMQQMTPDRLEISLDGFGIKPSSLVRAETTAKGAKFYFFGELASALMNSKGVWLNCKENKPKGEMILWRYPGGNKWRLSLAYKAKAGHYVDCGGAAGGNLADMTHFMEIPE